MRRIAKSWEIMLISGPFSGVTGVEVSLSTAKSLLKSVSNLKKVFYQSKKYDEAKYWNIMTKCAYVENVFEKLRKYAKQKKSLRKYK